MERYQRLTARQAEWLQLIMNNRQQVMIITCIQFDKHIEITCGVMALHHFRDLLQSLQDLIKTGRILKIQSDISTCFVADLLWLNQEL